MGKFSRDKGARAEREIARLVAGRRTGYAGTDNPDVTTKFALYSVKDTRIPISLAVTLVELIKLQLQDSERHHFVAVKVDHQWLTIETLQQHVGDHI